MFGDGSSLRVRIVALCVGIFGLISVGRSVWVYSAAQRAMGQFQETALEGKLRQAASTSSRADLQALLRDAPNRASLLTFLSPVGGAVLLRDDAGRLVAAPPEFDVSAIPFGAPEARTRETGAGITAQLDTQLAGAARVRTEYVPGLFPDGGYIQVVLFSTRFDQALGAIAWELALSTAVALLAITFGAWFVVQRALRPVVAVAREARNLTAERLEHRLPLPAGRDEFGELVATLNEMLDRLEAAFRSQERFVANAAHELRTPVTQLLGEVQVLLKRPRTTEEYEQFAVGAQETMRTLGRIVESLLLLARADAGIPLSGAQLVSPNEVVMDAVERTSDAARQRRVHVVPTLLPAHGEHDEVEVVGDAELLNTMLVNLLQNAIRHSPDGGTVDVIVVADASAAKIIVRDHGPGIPEDQRARIFERFVQMERGTPGAAGLGLAIASSVVRIHRGSILVRNVRDSGGSEFVVRLPRATTPVPR